MDVRESGDLVGYFVLLRVYILLKMFAQTNIMYVVHSICVGE